MSPRVCVISPCREIETQYPLTGWGRLGVSSPYPRTHIAGMEVSPLIANVGTVAIVVLAAIAWARFTPLNDASQSRPPV